MDLKAQAWRALPGSRMKETELQQDERDQNKQELVQKKMNGKPSLSEAETEEVVVREQRRSALSLSEVKTAEVVEARKQRRSALS